MPNERTPRRLGFLGDIIPVPPLGIVSIGDVVLGAGVFILVTRLMAPDKRRIENNQNENNQSENKQSENNRSGNNQTENNRSEGGASRHRQPNTPEPPPFSGCR